MSASLILVLVLAGAAQAQNWGPKQCRTEAYSGCTQICGKGSTNCQVTKKDQDAFFSNCRSLFTWEICAEEVLTKCTPKARGIIRPAVRKSINSLMDHCEGQICNGGVDKCFGRGFKLATSKKGTLTKKSLARLCEFKETIAACYTDLQLTQDLYNCPGASSKRTPAYQGYYDLAMTQCSADVNTETDNSDVTDGEEGECLEKATECSEFCAYDDNQATCTMSSTIIREKIDNCKSLFDFDACVDRVAEEECPDPSTSITEVRGVIETFKDKCEDNLCAGGVELCFGDLKNLTTVEGEEKLTNKEKKLLCQQGVAIQECWASLDPVQELYGCRGASSGDTVLFQKFYDFIDRKCKDGDYIQDIPPRSDFECQEDAYECTPLCENGFCIFTFQSVTQFVRDCETMNEVRRCVEDVADTCPRNVTSIPEMRERLDSWKAACEFFMCGGGVEICFMTRVITISGSTGELTQQTIDELCPKFYEIEECERDLRQAQFDLDCEQTSSESTERFETYFETLEEECEDREEIYDVTPQPDDEERECLDDLEACSIFCENRFCSFGFRSMEEMLQNCATVSEWEDCVDGLENVCPIDSAVLAATRGFIDDVKNLCETKVCDGGLDRCFPSAPVVEDGQISSTLNGALCDRKVDIQQCANNLANMQEELDCSAADIRTDDVYQRYVDDATAICNSDGPEEPLNTPTDDECSDDALLDCTNFCTRQSPTSIICSLTPGSRRELYDDCERVLEWETCVEALAESCEDESLERAREMLEDFKDYCETEICEEGVEACFDGFTLSFNPESNTLADSMMPQMCGRTPAVVECEALMIQAQNLFECPYASTANTDRFLNYLGVLKIECDIVVEDNEDNPQVKVDCPENQGEFLACLTCTGDSEQDCAQNGQFLMCDGGYSNPVCEHYVKRDRNSGQVLRVERRCIDMSDCHDSTYGFDSLFCINDAYNKRVCRACTFQRSRCELNEVNECNLNQDECSDFASCTDTIDSYTCTCNTGFGGDGFTCTDDDECADGSNECDANADCANQPGSYTCECNPGYTGDGKTCRDIDECTEGGSSCASAAACNNIPGTYECACNAGYEGNGFTCTDVDECASDDGNACDGNADCINQVGSYTCKCYGGYGGSGFECEDINECATNEHGCNVYATCENTAGSFTCKCVDGFTGNGFTCDEVDECAVGSFSCGQYAVCVNEIGTYRCDCQDGYFGDGQTCTIECSPGYRAVNNDECQEINECNENSDNCDENAECNNTPGSYSCACNAGWVGDGTYCNDDDECADNSDDCGKNAICTNIPGSFYCTCEAGYLGDGVVCSDVDECAVDANLCEPNGECVDTEGSYRCECNPGFQLVGNQCEDANECLLELDECDGEARCINTPGSYDCECPSSMYGNGFVCEGKWSLFICMDEVNCHECLKYNFEDNKVEYYIFVPGFQLFTIRKNIIMS